MRAGGILIAAALAVCAAPAAGQSSIVLPKIIEGADPAIWSGAVASGPVTHKTTGAVFPDEFKGLKRVRLAALGGGDDVVLSYVGGTASLTIYVYNRNDPPELQLKGAIAALGVRNAQTFVWSDGPFDVDGAQKLRLFKGTYKTGIGPNTVLDYLYFGSLGGWTVKVRATLTAAREVTEEQRLDAAVRALPWSAILQANGACTGSACRATRTMPFDQHLVEMMLSGLLKDKAASAQILSAAPLFSRREGNREWTVYPLDDKLATLFTDNFGALSVTSPLYTLSLREKGKDPAIVRFFNGTPDKALFDRNVQALERVPESTPFVSPAVAAQHAPD